MDIEKLSITELESLAYRQLIVLQQTQNNINLIQARIAELQKKEDKNGKSKS